MQSFPGTSSDSTTPPSVPPLSRRSSAHGSGSGSDDECPITAPRKLSVARPRLNRPGQALASWTWTHGHTPIVECEDPLANLQIPAEPISRLPTQIEEATTERPRETSEQLAISPPERRRPSRRAFSIWSWRGRSQSDAFEDCEQGVARADPTASGHAKTGVEDLGPSDPGSPVPGVPLRRWSQRYSFSWTPRARQSEDIVYDPWKPLIPTLQRNHGSTSSSGSYQSTISQEKVAKPYDSETELRRVARELLRLQKWALLLGMLSTNAALIWAGLTYHEYYYIFLPLLCLNTFTQVFFAICITVSAAYTSGKRWLLNIPEPVPETPEKIVMLLPCYNEDRTEVGTSLESLTKQIKIDHHPRLIFVVVDGQAKAPGEPKSTQDFLLDDMFAGGTRVEFENGYCARDGFYMPVKLQHGLYNGVPYLVVGKRYNQGKRDSLCFARSFLWHYKNRSEELPTIFNPELFDYIGSVFTDYGLDTVDYLCGMDGDTEFDVDCVYELVKEMRRGGPKVVGVCGAVLVKFDEHPWGLWNLLQNTEYNMTQGLRRQFQSRVSGKVNCLPGCCQLIRIEEATFGDIVLRRRFGYVPTPNDTLTTQIMGVYSEDSIHASIIFSNFPQSQTRQALRARAYTTAPQSWPVYLSQRKRWALGSKSNEFVMIFRPGIIWIERLCSLITVITWWIGPFVLTAVFTLFIALGRIGLRLFEHNVTLGLLCVLLFRYIWSFLIVTWFPHNTISRIRFVVGYFVYLVASPFMNVIIMFYSLLYCDEISWGKTRAVADDDEEALPPTGFRSH